jgi:hypothetical protein
MKKQIAELQKAIILQKIDLQAEGIKPWDGKSKRIKNFISWEKRPSEIHKFKKKLPARLRAKVIHAAPVKWFDPNKLKTAQRNVIKKKLLRMMENPSIAVNKQDHEHYGMIYGIVARCKRGDFIYDSNHRTCINLLCGKKHPAHYIDLRNIDAIIKKLKDEDRK